MNGFKIFFIVVAMLFASTTFAQSKAQLAKMKQRLITELKIDNAKADSVTAIVQDFYVNARAVKSNTAMKDDERKLALQNSRKEEVARLRSQLNGEQIKKLQKMMQEVRQEKQNRRAAKDSTSVQ